MKIRILIKLSVTAGLLFYLFSYKVNISEIINQISIIYPQYYILAYFITLLGVLFCTKRWHYVLKTKNIKIDFSCLFKYYLLGVFYNHFLPGTIGGDATKMIRISSEIEGKKAELAISVIIERLFGLITIYFISIIAFIFYHRKLNNTVCIIIIVILGLMSLFFIFVVFKNFAEIIINKFFYRFPGFRLLADKIVEFNNNFNYLNECIQNTKMLIRISIVSLSYYFIAYIGTVFILLLAVNVHVSYIFLLSWLPLANLILMVPISLNGIGVRETIFVYFFSQNGVSAEAAVSVSILLISLSVINGLIGVTLDLVKK